MKNVGDRSLVMGALLVGLILAALMWFLAISPKLSSAATARTETATQIATNADLQKTLDQWVLDAEQVPAYTREIYKIRDILPQSESIPAVKRAISEIAESAGVEIRSDLLSESQQVFTPVSLAPQMEAVGLTSEIEGIVLPTLFVTTMNLEVLGSFEQVLNFWTGFTSREDRFFGVTNANISETASEGEGLVTATFTVYFYTLDRGVPGITARPPERPWPGTEEEDVEDATDVPFNPEPDTEDA